MVWVIPIIVLFASAFVFLTVAYLMGVLIPPIYNEVVAADGVQAMGYDRGAEVAVRIGLKYVLPFLALTIIIWLVLLRLRRDEYKGQRYGRR